MAVREAFAAATPPSGGAALMTHLGLLFRLKWTLTWRANQKSASAIFGIIFAVIFLVPFSLGLAVALGFGFARLPALAAEHLLRAALLTTYLVWVLMPLLGFSLNESYDVTRLFTYPISMRRVFAGTILGALIDLPTLLLLPSLAAVLYAFGGASVAAFVITLLVLALFLFHTLALSQAALLAMAGVLRSRRFRDIALVLVPLFWITYYIGSQTFFRRVGDIDWRAAMRSPAWDMASYLPPGLGARAIANAHVGNFGPALAFLLALGLATAVTVYVAGWLVALAYSGEEIGPAVPKKKEVKAAPGKAADAARRRESGLARAAGSRLSPVIAAIAEKEMRYFARDPYFKITLMNLVYMLFIGIFAFFNATRQRAGIGSVPLTSGTLWMVSSLLLFQESTLVFNLFGTDGTAARTLFNFPASRRQMLIGKNLMLYGAAMTVNLAFLLVLCGIARSPGLFGLMAVWMALALAVLVAVGNIVSVRLPYRVNLKGWRTRQNTSSGQGLAYTLLYLALFLLAGALLTPVLAALLVPTIFIGSVWLALTIPVAIGYTAGLYLLSLKLAEPLLLSREIEIMERVSQPES